MSRTNMMVTPSGRRANDCREGTGVAPEEGPALVSSEHVSDAVDDLAQFIHTIRLHCIDPARNRNRIYTLTWQRDLWGALTLVQRWGRCDRPGRSRATTYPDRSSAQNAIRRLLRRRLRHGYVVVDSR